MHKYIHTCRYTNIDTQASKEELLTRAQETAIYTNIYIHTQASNGELLTRAQTHADTSTHTC